MTIQVPAIGSRVRVQTNWADYFSVGAKNLQTGFIHEGVITTSEENDPEGTFRLLDRTNYFHSRKIILLARVSDMVVLEGPSESQEEPGTKWVTHTVQGSKGNIYTITQEDDAFTCDCQAGQKGRKCKHVQELRLKLKPRG